MGVDIPPLYIVSTDVVEVVIVVELVVIDDDGDVM